MATKIVYSNSCIPQEGISLADSSIEYRLDSDVSKKMSGRCEPTVTIANTYYGNSTLAASGSITLESSATVNFAFIKNTGNNDMTINIGGHGARMLLSANESISMQIDDKTIALASTLGTNYEYLLGKD